MVRGVAGDANARSPGDSYRGKSVSQPPEPEAPSDVLLVVAVGVLLPYTPPASRFGFTRLPAWYFVFLAGAVAVYLVLVEMVKRVLMRPATS